MRFLEPAPTLSQRHTVSTAARTLVPAVVTLHKVGVLEYMVGYNGRIWDFGTAVRLESNPESPPTTTQLVHNS